MSLVTSPRLFWLEPLCNHSQFKIIGFPHTISQDEILMVNIFISAQKLNRINCCQCCLKCSMKFNNQDLWSLKKRKRKKQFLLGGRVNLLFFWISICLKFMVSYYNMQMEICQKATVSFIHNSIYSHLIWINNAAV